MKVTIGFFLSSLLLGTLAFNYEEGNKQYKSADPHKVDEEATVY